MVESTDEHAYSEGVIGAVNGDFESADDSAFPQDVSPTESRDDEDQNDTAQSPHTARQVQEAHTNGHAVQDSILENGHSEEEAEEERVEPSADPARGQQEEPREELWRKRLYFVRMPKFPEENQYASKALQEELDVYRSQVQLLNESMNVIRVRAYLNYPDSLNLACQGCAFVQYKWAACILSSHASHCVLYADATRRRQRECCRSKAEPGRSCGCIQSQASGGRASAERQERSEQYAAQRSGGVPRPRSQIRARARCKGAHQKRLMHDASHGSSTRSPIPAACCTSENICSSVMHCLLVLRV